MSCSQRAVRFVPNLVADRDQANVNSAFVSGMKEDLNMYGNQLTTAITCWTVGYAIGQSELILSKLCGSRTIELISFP